MNLNNTVFITELKRIKTDKISTNFYVNITPLLCVSYQPVTELEFLVSSSCASVAAKIQWCTPVFQSSVQLVRAWNCKD